MLELGATENRLPLMMKICRKKDTNEKENIFNHFYFIYDLFNTFYV
jgi:hypothetical protein